MRRKTHLLPFFLVLPAALPGQTRAVIPAAARAAEGLSVEPSLLAPGQRTLLVIERRLLGDLAAAPIRSVTLRRDVTLNSELPNGMLGGWLDLEIRASWTTRSPRAPAADFAGNHGPRPAVVYRGEYRLADSPQLPPETRVAPFAPHVSARVPLQRAIAPATSGHLCLELVVRPHATKRPPRLWIGDAVQLDAPAASFSGTSCYRPASSEPEAAGLDPNAYVGGSLRLDTFGPPVAFAVAVIGGSDRKWGVLDLPLDLSPFGANGCSIYVSQDLVIPVPMRTAANVPDSFAELELETPALASLGGARIYSQWLFHDPGANALSLTMTNGVSVALAVPPPSLGVGLVHSDDVTARAGTVSVHRAPVLQLASQ